MVCLLDRETYNRWERWFNERRQMAIPDHYQARDYISPYANSEKGLWPDPPYKAPAPRKSAATARTPRDPSEPPLTPEERKLKKRLREAARVRLKRLNDAWDRAQAALMEGNDEALDAGAEREEVDSRRG